MFASGFAANDTQLFSLILSCGYARDQRVSSLIFLFNTEKVKTTWLLYFDYVELLILETVADFINMSNEVVKREKKTSSARLHQSVRFAKHFFHISRHAVELKPLAPLILEILCEKIDPSGILRRFYNSISLVGCVCIHCEWP